MSIPLGNESLQPQKPRLFCQPSWDAPLDERPTASGVSLVTGNRGIAVPLNPVTIALAVDALTTVIEMKRSAITRESKKLSLADNSLIDQWRNEIAALESQ